MAGLITVRLSRNDSQPWGFRLQGGKDFGAPLLVQKVNGGSLAEKAGLQVADAIIKVNGQEVFNLRHKEAQDVIVKAGNSFEVVISRSPGGTWKPAVTPVGNVPAPSPVGGAPAAVTKTSLAYQGPASPAIGSGHNLSARPFNATPQLNGVGDQGNVRSITSKQYNNPVGLYSEQAIAETLSAQTEVLTTGALGVNFMKNEKTYNSNNSEVLKLVQEIDNEPRDPEPVDHPAPAGGVSVLPPPPAVSGLRHVSAPVAPATPATPNPQSPALQPGQNICADCERLIVHMVGGRATSPRPMSPLAHQLPAPPPERHPNMTPPSETQGSPKCSDCNKIIVGVFVRIKDKNLHVECFKCATCGTSLKNVGYYNINNKLYCDIHAKLVARSNPPAPNLEPVTVPPGGRIPSGTFPAPQVSASAQSPQPGTLAPMPFHPPTSSVSAPKPFGGPPAPASAAPAPAPFSPATFSPAPPPPAPAPAPPAPSFFPKNLPDLQRPVDFQRQIDLQRPMFGFGRLFENRELELKLKEIEDMSCCLDKSKRMSVCSSEVCDLSEKKVATKAMGALLEDPNRASPIPFVRGDVVSEQFQASTQEAVRKLENLESSEQGNVQITRKSNVEETFERTQKMYTAEVTSSSQSTMQVRAASPEMEQIMAKRRAQMAYDSPNPTPTIVSSHFKHLQSERCLTPEIENLMNKPHGTWSPMPPACMVRPLSPNQVISFPPDMPLPPLPANVIQPRTATPEQFQEARETVERFVDHSKHVQQSQTTPSSRSNQGYNQQAASSSYSQSQQYTPRFDSSQGFSPYVPKSNGKYNQNGAIGANAGINGEPRQNSGYQQNGNNQNYGDNGNNKSQQEQRQPSDEKEPEVEEPDDREEGKWSKQEEKSKKKTSDEEESSRRVFSDFGGPQVLSSVDIESTLEAGVEKTSVKKSQKTQYASCEFETSRKSAVHQHDKNSEAEAKQAPAEKPPQEGPASGDKEETMTKSQVEEIIKQELNKVFHMAQTMEKTDYSQMYNQSQAEQQSKHEREHAHDKSSKSKVEQKAITSQYDVIKKTGKLTSALTTAPARTFTPQPLENNYPLPYQNLPSDFPLPRSHPEPPVVEKPGYIPITGGRDSPLVKALTIACDRPYSPLPIPTAPEVPVYATQPNRSSMLEALTTAPTTPFQIRPPSAAGEGLLDESKQVFKSTETKYESVQKFAPKPTQADFKPISVSTGTCQKQQVQEELKSAFKSTSKLQSSFVSSEAKHTEVVQQKTLSAPKPVERPITPSGLHPPNLLPYYQQNIGEIPLAHRSNSPIPHQIKAPSITPPRAQSVPRQGERRGSVKAMSEAYVQQVAALNSQQTSPSPVIGASSSSVSYVSAGAYSKGSTTTKTYSYQQEHKSIDSGSYQASPLAGKLPLAGETTTPKCSSPVLGKLDHTKQVFKPAIPTQQPTSAFRSSVAEQANLKQAPPYFVEEKEKPQASWVVVKDKENEGNKVSFKPPQPSLPSRINNLPNIKPLPGVNKPAEVPKPALLPGVTKPPSLPDVGPGAPKGGATGSTSAPRRGRGVLNAAVTTGGRIPLCGSCNNQIRGPFITALGKIWCPDHFVCVNTNCRRPLQDIGFVEDVQGLYCEFCFEQYLAPACSKCNAKIKGDCLNAIGKHFHPECFTCAYCGKLFGNSPFFLEDALPYCEADWNELFTTKCFSCGFPIEAGDRWVEALNNNYHSQCFNCTMCKKNLEGQSFFAKGGRPFCKTHAR